MGKPTDPISSPSPITFTAPRALTGHLRVSPNLGPGNQYLMDGSVCAPRRVARGRPSWARLVKPAAKFSRPPVTRLLIPKSNVPYCVYERRSQAQPCVLASRLLIAPTLLPPSSPSTQRDNLAGHPSTPTPRRARPSYTHHRPASNSLHYLYAPTARPNVSGLYHCAKRAPNCIA